MGRVNTSYVRVALVTLLCCATGVAAAAENSDTTQKLNRKQPRVRFEEAALSDALDIVADSAKVSIAANWTVLATGGISKDTPISMELDNVSDAAVLDVICRLTSSGRGAKAVWFLQNGIVQVTTHDDAERLAEAVKAYNGVGIAYSATGSLLKPLERTVLQADVLREMVPGLIGTSLEVRGTTIVAKGSPQTVAEIDRVIQLCRRPMTAAEWDATLGVMKKVLTDNAKVDIAWQDKPLHQCIAELSRLIKVPMVVDSVAGAAMPITLKMQQAKPERVLEMLLRTAASGGGDTKEVRWVAEPIAGGQVLWIGPAERARLWCASFAITPSAMNVLKVKRGGEEAAEALRAMTPGSEIGRIRAVGPTQVVCLQRFDTLRSIAQLVMDGGYLTAMRPASANTAAAK